MSIVVSVLPNPNAALRASSPVLPYGQTVSGQTVPGPSASGTNPLADTPADKKSVDETAAGKPATAETAPPPRIVSFSDAATGILIEATQNPLTGGLVEQFPNRALIESYGRQIRLQEDAKPAASTAQTPQAVAFAKAS